ncbi:MAG: PIG-L family deacetylase [Deltaproteobacteria bacterium]|nr:PIG-L family deacetylase [Deltaproteobacteria bacterium]
MMNILIFSVHPDDETLGCGGTLLRHAAQGDTLSWMIVTRAFPPRWSEALIAAKDREIAAVAEAYGVQHPMALGFPTTRLDTVPQAELIDAIREGVAKVRPEVIYCIYPGDVHTDHRVAFTALAAVCKPFYMHKFGIRRILSYETLSSTDAAPPLTHPAFVPMIYHDITPHMDAKVRVMELYASEAHPDPMPRGPSAIRALARYRGATIGVEYAEAFQLVREVA